MTAIKVADSLSNGPEHIIEAARAIGRSARKRKVFDALYYHKMRIKSVAEIVVLSGLSRMQVLQSGVELKKSGIIAQGVKNGDTAYIQIEFFQHNKGKILSFVNDPKKMLKVPTKRNVTIVDKNAVSFVKKRSMSASSVKRSVKPRPVVKQSTMRVAFLSANPDSAQPLRTDIEARNLARALKATTNRDAIEVRYVPAAEWQDFLDALNEFRPTIVHFSGHGGDQSVLLDNADVYDDGGITVDYDRLNDFIGSTAFKPEILVLNACDTVRGSKIFLENVKAVVAMEASIDDAAASYFTTFFYKALAEGQPLSKAVKQGRLALAASNLPDSELPKIVAAKTTNLELIKFF
jgi:CHAT domain